MDITSARSSLTFVLRLMFLVFHIGLSFARAIRACAALASTSGLDPSSLMVATKYLNFSTLSRGCPFTVMLFLIGSGLLTDTDTQTLYK